MNIISMLNQVDDKEIVLPAIQRDFVWNKSKILKLMDSILRGYPIGIVLLWETYTDIQYREFEKSYKGETKHSFHENRESTKLKLVLDGQQRLQSLYIALYGNYAGEYLYFDVLSGRHTDDFKEDKYLFYFVASDIAKQWNEDFIGIWSSDTDADEDHREYEKEYFCKVSELFSMGVEEKQEYREFVTEKLNLNRDDSRRLETNIARLDEVLTKDQNILKESVIDENKTRDARSRQTNSDVLEIFVRINVQGTPLSRSDLIFSMLKLNWKDSATALPDFVETINTGNSFAIDIDFVIRCLYAVSDFGTKFDIDLLRKKSNMKKMQNNFEKCCSAIAATVDCVQKYCWVSSSKAFGGTLNLVPFVYYLFHLPSHDIPNNQIDHFRKAFFLFCFAGPFSRYADSRLGKFIKSELLPLNESNDYAFPFARAVLWTHYWEQISNFDLDLIQRNPRLALHLVQGDSGAATKFKLNSREIDHIFPRSKLRDKGFEEAKVNHFANFWILGKGKNLNKTNKDPKEYFKDVPAKELKNALIDKELLIYSRYNKFIKQRSEAILEKVTTKIGFGNSDFSTLLDSQD